MDYLKKVFTKQQKAWLLLTGVVLALFLLIVFIGNKLANSEPSQTVAKAWARDEDYSQISIFFSDLANISENNIKELDFKIDQKLDEDSIMTKSLSARRRVSAYSLQGMVTGTFKTASKEYKAIGCGGDYFIFHPLKLIDGSYFDGDDLMKDHVIIDEDAAWDFFGSTDAVGQFIEINGQRHLVCGVIKRDEGRLNSLAGNDVSTIYMSYESMVNVAGYKDITCYEVLLPNPVKNYAKETVEKAASFEESRFELVENSRRFKWTRIIKFVPAFGSRSMNGKSIVFPYWENIARGLEDILTPICTIGLILITFVIVNVAVLLWRMWKKRTIHFSDLKKLFEKLIDNHRKKVRKKKEEGEYI